MNHWERASDSMGGLARLYRAAFQQAAMLRYLDAFKAFAVIFLLLLPLLVFVRPGLAGAGAHGSE
jgi:hypothetical protein